MPDWLQVTFQVSGVHTALWIPPLTAFIISYFSAMVGISGAFLLLPFQMSVLHYTSPAVSATNLVFNLVAIPSGVYRYVREGRMLWPLTWIVAIGTLPGIGIGYFVRVYLLPEVAAFKMFVGAVLLYIGLRALWEFMRPPAARSNPAAELRPVTGLRLGTMTMTVARVSFEFQGQRHAFSVPGMFALAVIVGIIGGIYGVGGGAFIAPFCVTVFRLPIHTVAGAALAATLLTSIAGVAAYSVLPAPSGMATQPDWSLGLLFGLGGFAGMYLGARTQKFINARALKFLLGALVLSLALYYLLAGVLA